MTLSPSVDLDPATARLVNRLKERYGRWSAMREAFQSDIPVITVLDTLGMIAEIENRPAWDEGGKAR